MTPPSGRDLLRDKVVVITAAAGAGIGAATAERCVAEGARVLISDVHPRRLRETVQRLGERAERAGSPPPRGQRCDVRSEEEVQALCSAAVEQYGRIDAWINNAGLGGTAQLVEMSDAQWSVVLDVSLTGTMRCMRAAMRHMIPRGSGVIVNNASVLGWRAQAGQSHYAAAKAGVMALTRCAAMEAAPAGVRINAVAPSLAMHPYLEKVSSPELLEELTRREAFGRAAEPWEIATVIAMLCSDYTTYLTGEVVSVSSQRA